MTRDKKIRRLFILSLIGLLISLSLFSSEIEAKQNAKQAYKTLYKRELSQLRRYSRLFHHIHGDVKSAMVQVSSNKSSFLDDIFQDPEEDFIDEARTFKAPFQDYQEARHGTGLVISSD